MEPDNSYQFEDAPTPPRHTQFLDLTNGAGGDHRSPYDDEEDEEMMHIPGMAGSTSTGASTDSRPALIAPASNIGTIHTLKQSSPTSLSKYDTSTPGKVVETGQEHTGRWTKEEHESFLNALKVYGKEWKKVAAKVKTRTVVQTRTHAQKYFQKLQKVQDSGDSNVSEVQMGSGNRTSSTKKKRPSVSSKSSPPLRATAAPRQSSVTSAAHLISNLSSNELELGGAPASGFVKPQAPVKPNMLFPAAHGFTTFSAPSTGFQTGAISKTTMGGYPMKIVAPEPDAASKRGKFPEPSPAACGKRKLAEIAAARMLAGVAGGKPLLGDVSEDGTATPPPVEAPSEAKVHMHDVPPPPIIPSSSRNKPSMGLSLQIVNPETLGVSFEAQQKRRREGNNSPQTPWEGQLAALVR